MCGAFRASTLSFFRRNLTHREAYMGFFDLFTAHRQRAYDIAIQDTAQLVRICTAMRAAYTKPESTQKRDVVFVTNLESIQAIMKRLQRGGRQQLLRKRVRASVLSEFRDASAELAGLRKEGPVQADQEDVDAILFTISSLAGIIRHVLIEAPGYEQFGVES
jgi:hypothetical protein